MYLVVNPPTHRRLFQEEPQDLAGELCWSIEKKLYSIQGGNIKKKDLYSSKPSTRVCFLLLQVPDERKGRKGKKEEKKLFIANPHRKHRQFSNQTGRNNYAQKRKKEKKTKRPFPNALSCTGYPIIIPLFLPLFCACFFAFILLIMSSPAEPSCFAYGLCPWTSRFCGAMS